MKRLFAILAALFLFLAGVVPWIATKVEGGQADDPVGAEPVAEWIYEDPEEGKKIEAALDWRHIDNVTLTAYCPCEICCGEYALDRPGGIVYTASGAVAQAGQTIAVDPDVIPLGAWVEIDGKLYHAEDTGAFSGSHVDIYFGNHSDALKFGVKHENIRWMSDDL